MSRVGRARALSIDLRRLSDEPACLAVLDDFVSGRVGAAVFIMRFRHLWRAVTVEAATALAPPPGERAAVLAAVNALCASYLQGLPAGGGYRVSEEQFRKELRSLAAGLAPPGAHG